MSDWLMIFCWYIVSSIIVSKLGTFLLELAVHYQCIVRGTRSVRVLVCSWEYWRGVSYHSYTVWVLIVSLGFSTWILFSSLLPRVWGGLEGEEGGGKGGVEIMKEDLEVNYDAKVEYDLSRLIKCTFILYNKVYTT